MRNNFNHSFYHQAGQKLTNHAKNSFIKAELLAKKSGHKKVDSIDLLYAIYLEKGSLGSNIMKDLGIKRESFAKFFTKPSADGPVESAALVASEGLKTNFTKAYGIAKDFNCPYVGTEHLTYAIFTSSDSAILDLIADTHIENAGNKIKSLFDPSQLSNLPKIFEMPEINFGKASTKKSSATPFIDKFCLDMNGEVKKKNEIIVGREKEIDRMINILGRKNKNNPLLIGDPGVGKTALVSGLAQRINSATVPPSLYRKKIMNLDVAQLIAGTSFRGEFESRLKEIIKEASSNKDIILFIDEVHTIVGAGNLSGSLDLANIIKPALARGEMQLIGATTFSEYKKHIEKDAALERRFQPVQVHEPSPKESEEILFGIRINYERFHNVTISDEAIRLAVDLSVRYVQNRFLPDKAIDVIDETASNIRSKNKVSDFIRQIKKLEDEKLSILEEKEKLVEEQNYEKAIRLRSEEKKLEAKIKFMQAKQGATEKNNPVDITPADIIETISKMSGIPMDKLVRERTKKIKNIKKILNSNIIGQEEAMEKLSNTILRSQSGISDPDRPLGSFLFLGPTGVGKTLSAKVLAKEFFGSAKSLIRIDMSELMERHSLSSLIGSPAGYVGYGEGGNLTEKVRRNPYSVILFDEIEKAHPDVFNILLQILEDGILTDAEGTPVNFKQTIVILTSNIGTDDFTSAASKIRVGFGSEDKINEVHKKFNEIKDSALAELERMVRPELLNRLDHIIVFDSLGEKEIKSIAQQELDKLAQRIEKLGIKVALKNDVAGFITKKSIAFNQGARLVRKNIQELIENRVAEMIMYEKITGNKITISARDNKLEIK